MAAARGGLILQRQPDEFRNPIATTYNSLDSFRLAGGFAWRTLTKSRFSASSIARSDPP
jgi:hypothetical protein